MKIYDWAAAPNPKRLRMFLVEKGITNIEIVQVSGENLRLKPEYVAKYPQAMVPMLELDDGRQIGESIAICRYFEELYPNPPLLGRDPYERAIVDMWERRAFDEGMMAAGEVFRNTAEAFKDRGLPGFATAVPQLPELVQRGRDRLDKFFKKFDEQLGKTRFIAGDQFTLADCTLYCSIEFAGWSDIGIPADCKNLQRWWKEVSDRPSAKA
ncbi:MAG: glutathione S-transferase family protein [Rhizobacter sp.]|jgi:glutathione S-transferase|nr:glutathione S-transferase family protein [Rhizobacter sp.]MBP6270443.1 glutathione S-transferase family protein [Rhizobacter sp.]